MSSTRVAGAMVLCLVGCVANAQAVSQDKQRANERAAQAKREAAFAKLMTGCRMVGSFTTGDRRGRPPSPETYTIAKVEKVRGHKWRFFATIEYAGRSIQVPVLVDVLWAGDTPMIQVTDLKVPLAGTYTARVLIYKDHYAGMWSGTNHGGEMFGRIEPASGTSKKTDRPKTRPASQPIRPKESSSAVWPSFRGIRARGVADGFSVPATWNAGTGKNIRWKTEIPGLAHSSPVIWGDRLFVTTAVAERESKLTVGLYGSVVSVADEGPLRFLVLCLDKTTGQELWRQVAWKGVPKVKRHPKGSHAASTPTTDGNYVVAFFGSEGLYCYTVSGKLVWKKDFGVLDCGYYRMPTAQWGFASSPVIHDGRVLVQCDVQGGGFVAALDVKTGKVLWRTKRDEVPTWSTPTVDIQSQRRQVILNGYKQIGGYDLDTGALLWQVSGGGDIPVPTPIVAHGLIYITSAHGRRAPILAISADAQGDLELDADQCAGMVWSKMRRGNYMQTPLVYRGMLYCCHDMGILTCLDAKTGERIYRKRLGDGRTGFTASGVAADGKLFFASEEGDVHVLRATREFTRIAINPLGETVMATPAVSEGTLYFRARRHLFAVASED